MQNRNQVWRWNLAERIGAAYAANPKARAVMVAGSTGRGNADRFSDLEIDVYWAQPPTPDERRQAVARAGGILTGLEEDADEWEEQMSFNGFHAATSTFLVSTMERYLQEVLEEFSTAENPQMRLYSLLHAQTFTGEELIQGWRARARQYPAELTAAMLHENLVFDGFGYAEDMLAARDDRLYLYSLFVNIERQVLGALLGLNRIYLPNPYFKSMDETIGEMRIKPAGLSNRLKEAFQLPPVEGVQALHNLIEDLFRLVEQYQPGFDVDPYREKVRQRRPVWDQR